MQIEMLSATGFYFDNRFVLTYMLKQYGPSMHLMYLI